MMQIWVVSPDPDHYRRASRILTKLYGAPSDKLESHYTPDACNWHAHSYAVRASQSQAHFPREPLTKPRPFGGFDGLDPLIPKSILTETAGITAGPIIRRLCPLLPLFLISPCLDFSLVLRPLLLDR